MMKRIDPAWLNLGWLMLLAYTGAILVVALLSRPFRRMFGAERAFQLWLLPPLGMLASQWPHAPSTAPSIVVRVVSTLTAAVRLVPAGLEQSNAIDWRAGILLIWFVGVAITLGIAVRSQLRYQSRMLRCARWVDAPSRWPVLLAEHADIGPAMVGAWRVRIVLPSDFHDRYDATERALILAHEAIHADRRDGWWSLLARIIVAVFWFHPLAWWALAAMRHDQELACDAAVMRNYSAHRRSYASAMLKTQSAALVLPIGCLWSPRHPITERIAMLKFSAPSYRRRIVGVVFLSVVAAGCGGLVYSANPSMEQPKPAAASPQLLQVAMRLNQGANVLATPTICVRAGELAGVSLGNGNDNKKPLWTFDVRATPLSGALVQVEVNGSGSALDGKTVHFVMRDAFDKPMIVKIDNKKGAEPLELSMTPRQSCETETPKVAG